MFYYFLLKGEKTVFSDILNSVMLSMVNFNKELKYTYYAILLQVVLMLLKR